MSLGRCAKWIAGMHPDVDLRITEGRALPRENHVAGHRDGHAAAARSPADGGDRRLAEVVLGVVQVDVERLEELADSLRSFAEQDVEVESGGETLRNGAGDHDDARLPIVRGPLERGDDATNHLQAERVDRRPREHDAREIAGRFVADDFFRGTGLRHRNVTRTARLIRACAGLLHDALPLDHIRRKEAAELLR